MKKFAFVIGVLLVSGCTIVPTPNTNVAIYNFAAHFPDHTVQTEQKDHAPQSTQNSKKILVPHVSAPLWLDNKAIHYRLAYHHTARDYTYANSRWSAAPAFILTQQIKQKITTATDYLVISSNSMAIAEYELHIELEEFSQVFDSLQDSHTVIRFRASLVNNAHRLIAQKVFSQTQPTPTTDAAGAVSAFTTASSQLMDTLIHWLEDELVKI